MVIATSVLLCVLLVAAMAHAYHRTGDALHPAMYLGPMLAYAYAYRPVVLQREQVLDLLFEPGPLLFVLIINFMGVSLFVLGLLGSGAATGHVARAGAETLSPGARDRAAVLGVLLGLVAAIGFGAGIAGAGGLALAYGQAKGGVAAASGYLVEISLLAFPAIGMLSLAWQGRGLDPLRGMLLLLCAAPCLVHGILGARRGPSFMILMALIFAAHLITGRRPRAAVVLPMVAAVGLLVIWLVNNRDRIYLGTEWQPLQPSSLVHTGRCGTGTGDDWAYGGGVILTARQFGGHAWGWRYLAQLLVHPVPRQLWPTKYDDVGLGWLTEQGALCGYTPNEWKAAVGWTPAMGSASGFVSDFYFEFGCLGLAACFGFGRLYRYLWRCSAVRGGSRRALYLFAIILSIYVPMQNFNAWYYRFVLMSVPTLIIWRLYLDEPQPPARRVAVTVPRQSR